MPPQMPLDLQGRHHLGHSFSRLGHTTFRATEAATGKPLAPDYADATADEVQRSLELATEAFRSVRDIPRQRRADLLEAIAQAIEDLGEPLLERAAAETALPLARLRGERGRTTSQLRLFADQVRDGRHLDACIETAEPNRSPIPKPDLRKIRRPLGPVVVFGAGNFPLAFSVAGGDTASALAAGCPVVVKAHPHHPGTSEAVAVAVRQAVVQVGFPDGTFSMLHGKGHDVGSRLVSHPLTRAVAFTGSLRGGKALFDLAMARPRPIPVFAEMGSVNPVVVLPEKLRRDTESLARGLAASVTLGVGQFCTNPGLVLLIDDTAADTLVARLGHELQAVAPGTMLHAGIRQAYEQGIRTLKQHGKVTALPGIDPADASTDGTSAGDSSNNPNPAVRAQAFQVDADDLLQHPELGHEIFGPVTLVVRCRDAAQLGRVIESLDGQLTATVLGTAADLQTHRRFVDALEDRVGRLLFAGFPTGVEVSAAMHHGGPYPATTEAATTSVGTAAMQRFSRPICYQDAPDECLPVELRDANPEGLWRWVNGQWSREAVG